MPFGLDALPFWVMARACAIFANGALGGILPGAVLSWPSWPHSALVLMTFGFVYGA